MGSPISKEVFLARARSRFGDRYSYEGILYKSYKTPIRIRCQQHPVKEIVITPEKHLQTTGGCRFCLREKRIAMLERELLRTDALPLAEGNTSSKKNAPGRGVRGFAGGRAEPDQPRPIWLRMP
ncbi:MAG: hypothetical protein VKO00_00715 [Cyanobacteriota bacterium]|nr:hypothetical protein [Cyanobacteriota bacterium]